MTMDCLQVHAWDGELSTAETAVPDVEPGTVLLDVRATGVGLTVKRAINGGLGSEAGDLPRIPGHEIVGEVAAVGQGVTHVEPGDFVGAYFYLVCDHCPTCQSGNQALCENHAGFVGVDVDGGFAEHVRLPRENVIKIPETIDPVGATAIPDAIATPYHIANQRARITPTDAVLVLGAGGGVGMHMVQMAQHFGGAVTAVDRSRDKLAKCVDVGAVETINTATTAIATALDDLGGRYDAIIDFTGSTDLIEATLRYLDPGGRFVHLTAYPDSPFEVTPRTLVRGELDILGSRYCSKGEFATAAQLVADGIIEPVVTENVQLDAVPALLDRIQRGDVVGRGAVVP